MKRMFFIVFFVSFIVVFSFAQQKFALVVGNGAYRHTTPLNNPVNDANDVAAELRKLGWNVDILPNATQEQMESAAIRLKSRLLSSKNSYGFFFYAGHAVQSNGENFLLPVDANIQSESFLRSRSVSVQAIMDELNAAGNELNIVVLDACRDNPFGWSRSGTRGLSIVSHQPADSIIVFATSAGAVASDGTGRNGLFTTHFLPHLRTPGLEVTEIFRRTMGDVSRASNNQQRPAVYNQFYGIAYFGNRTATPNVDTSIQNTPSVSTTHPSVPPTPVKTTDSKKIMDYFFGYSYLYNLPLGFTIGTGEFLYPKIQLSLNFSTKFDQIGWTTGLSYTPIFFRFHNDIQIHLLAGLGVNHIKNIDDWEHKFAIDIGLKPVMFDYYYVSATYRLIGFRESGFSVGVGIVLYNASQFDKMKAFEKRHGI